jgi:hypothetical protein
MEQSPSSNADNTHSSFSVILLFDVYNLWSWKGDIKQTKNRSMYRLVGFLNKIYRRKFGIVTCFPMSATFILLVLAVNMYFLNTGF